MPNKNWLPHITEQMMIGARNNNLDSYLVALEGWRRGLDVTFYSRRVKQGRLHAPGCLFSLSSESQTHMFYKSRGLERVKGTAFSIGDNKFKAKQFLSEHGISVPKGNKFSSEVEDAEILAYAMEIGFPVVIKPAKAAQGKGVIANIEGEEFFKSSLKYVREQLGYKEVIVEQYVTGKEYRLYVLEDEVIAVLNRVPSNIVGDGVHTIRELIQLKNKERKKNPRLYSCLIKVDYEVEHMLEKVGYSLTSVPKKGELVYLREKSNITSGGDSIEVMDEFPDELKQMAIQALKIFPDFAHGGVDMIADLDKPLDEAAYIIELTPVPQIGSLIFPMEGKARDIPAAVVDYYFPETKDRRNANPHLYFNFTEILAPLNSKSASEITILPVPEHVRYAKKYTINGKVQKVGFRRWIRKKAIEADLFGFAQNQDDGSLTVVVAGSEKSVNAFRQVCETGPVKADVKTVTEEVWKKPIKICFEIKQNTKTNKEQKTAPAKVKQNQKKQQPQTFSQKVKRKLKTYLK